jgi:hypothetical protein
MDSGTDGLKSRFGRHLPYPDDPGPDELASLGSRGLDIEAVAEEIEADR